MSWVATRKDGREVLTPNKPFRANKHKEPWSDNLCTWVYYQSENGYQYRYKSILLPKGSIKKLIGRDLTWDDEPVELK